MGGKNSKRLKSWQELATLYRAAKTLSPAPKQPKEGRKIAAVSQNTADSTDLSYFAAAMKNVKPLKTTDRAYVAVSVKARNKPQTTPLAVAISDEMDISSYLTEYNGVPGFSRNRGDTALIKKLYGGAWPVQSKLDLHGLTVVNARLKFANWLRQCLEQQLRCVLVIHGVGYHSQQPAKLNRLVKVWAVQSQQVMAFIQAPPNLGANGATIILLKKNRTADAQSQK